jgi:hypothetical protein
MSQPRCSQTTAEGLPCRKYAMIGSDRCAAHVGLVGPKTLLTNELTDQLATILRAGNYLGVALRAVGLHRRTFHDWMKRGTSERERDAEFRVFRERIRKARAEGEVRNVAHIARAAVQSWQAAAWLLERQYPERWARPTTRELRLDEEAPTGTPEASVVEDDPFAEVDELAERRRQRRSE